ncbi:hypothetical protein [Aliiroseovarius sp. YM-037]|uniref:hypothetical protein n=1 Tax=Aliiroseovarius sp. YM-037 TaxID=3341728 RepID=UPI003A803F7E
MRCISIKRLKIHELEATLRYLHKDDQVWTRKSAIYGEIQDKAIKSFVVFLGKIVIAYLIATSLRNGNELALKVSNFEASVPAAFFLFAVSLLLLISAMAFNHLSAAMTLKNSLATKIKLIGFSVNAYDLLQNRSDNALGVPVVINPFFREALPISSMLAHLLLIAMFTILVPIVAFGYYVFDELVMLGMNSQISAPERISAFAGAAITILSAMYVVLFHLPLPVIKNTKGIRWGFLYSLPPHPSDQEKFSRWSRS